MERIGELNYQFSHVATQKKSTVESEKPLVTITGMTGFLGAETTLKFL